MGSQLDGDESENAEVLTRVHLRYEGTDTSIPLALSDLNQMSAAFEKAHRRQFGFVFEGRNLVVEAVEVEAVSAGRAVEATKAGNGENKNDSSGEVEFFSGGEWLQAQVRHREALGYAEVLVGPALLVESHQTVVVEPGWQAELDHSGCLVLRRVEALKRSAPVGTSADPILLEVFNNLFMSTEQMGVTLQNTAHSVNIKERLDFSCAVFAADGSLVANAPHMPVHLGSMDRSVESVIRQNSGQMKPGDVYVLNAPYNGGTHLPDITVVTPVFDNAGAEVLLHGFAGTSC